ncbi:MAG: hypothetical protein J6Y33_08025, partial [Prevotella sp.]|nr:hypothetical protein [Prevotella sp.]
KSHYMRGDKGIWYCPELPALDLGRSACRELLELPVYKEQAELAKVELRILYMKKRIANCISKSKNAQAECKAVKLAFRLCRGAAVFRGAASKNAHLLSPPGLNCTAKLVTISKE